MSKDTTLSTVHDAMIRAVDETKKPNLEPYTFKVDPGQIEMAADICKRNGTTLPAFMRHCVACLIDDYAPPKHTDPTE